MCISFLLNKISYCTSYNNWMYNSATLFANTLNSQNSKSFKVPKCQETALQTRTNSYLWQLDVGSGVCIQYVVCICTYNVKDNDKFRITKHLRRGRVMLLDIWYVMAYLSTKWAAIHSRLFMSCILGWKELLLMLIILWLSLRRRYFTERGKATKGRNRKGNHLKKLR